ncbi:MAG: hypothetical protein CMP59_07300 [Flavobacteriales bacterium]|nr:hypothetical protein [Flavobacteriales bacterium]
MRRLSLLLPLFFSLCFFELNAQKLLNVSFSKEFNEQNDNHINAAIKTTDGYYLVTGYTLNNSAGGRDIWVAKMTVSGEIIWQEALGDINNDEGTALVENDKGEYAIVGHSISPTAGYTEGWFLKFSDKGKLKKKTIFNLSPYIKLYDIELIGGSDFAVAGVWKVSGDNDENLLIMKLNSNGVKLWNQQLGTKYFPDEGLCLHVTDQDEIIAGGFTTLNSQKRRLFLIKTDSYGKVLFKEEIGDEGMNAIQSIAETPDGKIILAGYSSVNSNGEEDAMVMIFDSYKKIISQKTFGRGSSDKLNAIKPYKGGYLVIGTSNSLKDDGSRMYIAKLDKDLEVLWERVYETEKNSFGSDLIINLDGFTAFGSVEQDKTVNSVIITYEDNTNTILAGISDEKAKEDTLKKYAVLDGMTLLENVVNEEFADVTFRGSGDPLKGLNVSRTLDDLKVGDYYALIIGIDKYSGSWKALNNAVNDAKAVESLLKSKYRFTQFKTLYNEQASRTNIIAALEWLVENVRPEDNVFIYYSGHGEFKKELNKGYWVPYGATTMSTSNYISNSDIQTFIKGIQSNHTLLVADACFSGDIFRGNTMSVPFENSPKYYKKVHSLKSRQAMTSGGLEPVMDGGQDGHSVFAYYLLKALRENESKMMDASQIFDKLKIPVYNNSDQSPDFKPIGKSGDEGGQFIFMKK